VTWSLMRATGVVSLALLTVVLALGIAGANRWMPGTAPRFVVTSIHRSLSLLSVVFVGIHVVTALVDRDAAVSLAGVVVPRASWLGAGALSLDLVAALIVTSLLRRRLGYRAWRAVHWLAYVSWPTAFAHGLGLGSDVGSHWFRAFALGCLGIVVTATAWRLVVTANPQPASRMETWTSHRTSSSSTTTTPSAS
jgi:sulfoxide reductase heme-binding subunit YedZ